MQVFLIYMVPHLSPLYYTSLPLGTYSYLTKASKYLNHGAILLKALGGGIRVIWTHISSLFFGSLVVLDVVSGFVLLFLLDIQVEHR